MPSLRGWRGPATRASRERSRLASTAECARRERLSARAAGSDALECPSARPSACPPAVPRPRRPLVVVAAALSRCPPRRPRLAPSRAPAEDVCAHALPPGQHPHLRPAEVAPAPPHPAPRPLARDVPRLASPLPPRAGPQGRPPAQLGRSRARAPQGVGARLCRRGWLGPRPPGASQRCARVFAPSQTSVHAYLALC